MGMTGSLYKHCTVRPDSVSKTRAVISVSNMAPRQTRHNEFEVEVVTETEDLLRHGRVKECTEYYAPYGPACTGFFSFTREKMRVRLLIATAGQSGEKKSYTMTRGANTF